jgi:hypothetical protein
VRQDARKGHRRRRYEEKALATVTPSDVRIDGGTSATVGAVRLSKASGEWQVEGDLDFVRSFLSGPLPER